MKTQQGRTQLDADWKEWADRVAKDWKYIPLSRQRVFLEDSIIRGTQWAVFEPDNELLWSRLRKFIGLFMRRLFLKGVFKGRTPRKAYYVKCGPETTSEADQANGIVNIVVGFAPLKPAEFVVIKIEQIARPPGST